ncbi:MAG: glycoside hydrolase family 97 N-terminal domain-containing protein, partial [Ginsengibacter sp.]
MKFLQSTLTVLLIFISATAFAQKNTTYQLASPDRKNILKIEAGYKLQWSVTNNSTEVIAPSAISMQLQNGEVLGNNVKIISAKSEKINSTIKAIDYIKDIIPDVYDQLVLNCKGDYGIIFRAYNDGVAYRFFTMKNGQVTIVNEAANFNFDKDYKCYV